MSDRRVHAITAGGDEIVRYDRAGKWYVESTTGLPRRALSIGAAARLATEPGAVAFTGRVGGSRFDSLVRQSDSVRLAA